MYNSKKVKTRKIQTCVGCGLLFPIGIILKKYSCIFEGDFQHGYLCKICDDYLKTYSDLGADGFETHSLRDCGWGPDGDDQEYIDIWLKSNKPLSVLWSHSFGKKKGENYNLIYWNNGKRTEVLLDEIYPSQYKKLLEAVDA